MTQRDAVDVAADARTIAKRIVNEHIRGARPSITHSDMVDAIAEAHRSASNSGAEAMRDAVIAAFPDEPPGRLRLEPEEVRAIVRALPLPAPGAPASPWRDMQSAPKDGTRIDLWGINLLTHDHRGERLVNVKWGPVRDWMGNEREDWQHGRGEDFKPTYWMPLPTPPASKDT